MKRCSKCGIEKDESEFHKNKHRKDGLSGYCKSCKHLIDRERYLKHGTEMRLQRIEHYYTHEQREQSHKPRISKIRDPTVINEVLQMKQNDIPVSDISIKLSHKYGLKISQSSIWRALQRFPISCKPITFHPIPGEPDYPSRKEIENLFSELLQKENDLICIYGGEKLKRKLMIRILNFYLYKEFTYTEARIELNRWVGESGFYQHWQYLSEHNFIEKVDDYKFKFCDRVKKWKNFGQV